MGGEGGDHGCSETPKGGGWAGRGRPQSWWGGGGGGVQQIQLRTEDTDLGAVALLVRGTGGSCNFVQEISVHVVKFS